MCLFCSNVPANSVTQKNKQQISVLNVQTVPIIALILCTYSLGFTIPTQATPEEIDPLHKIYVFLSPSGQL